MKKTRMLLLISLVVLVMLFAGCKKKSTMPVETAEPVPAPKPVQTWEAPDTNTFSAVDLEAELARKIKENLQVLYFEYDQHNLTNESLQKLQIASNFLKQQPQLRIRLDGHADERGTTDYNMALAEKRARAVFDVLVRYGIERARMETTSFGREKPAHPNCGGNESCHALNRRVEYTVIKK